MALKPISKIAAGVQASTTLAIDSLFKQMKAEGKDVVGFGAGEPDFPTPEHIKQAGIEAIENNQTKYTPAAGLMDLRKAACYRLKEDCGLDYEPTQIVVASGAKHSVYIALMTLCNPGDEVVIAAPYWVSYSEMVKQAGAIPVIVAATEEADFKITAEQLDAAITDKTKVFMLNSPSNPTGMVYTKAELEAIAEVCCRHNIYVIADEIYCNLVYDNNEFVSFASLGEDVKERTILVNGVSKSYAMTGWRIGYLLAPEAVIEQTGKIAELMHSSVNSLAQYAGVAALAGPQDHVAAMREEYRAKRQIVLDGLAGCPVLRLIEPQGAFYAFVDVRLTGLDSGEFADRLLDEEHVAVGPGEAFGEEGRGFVRLSYAGDAGELREGVARLRAFAERVWNPITGHHTATYHPMEVLA